MCFTGLTPWKTGSAELSNQEILVVPDNDKLERLTGGLNFICFNVVKSHEISKNEQEAHTGSHFLTLCNQICPKLLVHFLKLKNLPMYVCIQKYVYKIFATYMGMHGFFAVHDSNNLTL